MVQRSVRCATQWEVSLASVVMCALVMVVTALLLLEGKGYNFCPTCAKFPLEDLALGHRYAERCNVLESWRHSIGRELCPFLCTEGYDGQVVVLPCFGGVCKNATDFPHCVRIATQTSTTSTMTTVTPTQTATTKMSVWVWQRFFGFLSCLFVLYCFLVSVAASRTRA